MTAPPLRFIGYADETRYNIGRYRGVALLTMEAFRAKPFAEQVRQLLGESGVTELKWQKVDGAKDRFAALKVLTFIFEKAFRKEVRADVLVWDCHDKRHVVNRRDDVANLQRMYYHIFKNVIRRRWPDGGSWILCPDENTSLDWEAVEVFVRGAGERFEITPSLGPLLGFNIRLRTDFHIEEIRQSKSHLEPLVQAADVFAGMAAFSHERYALYEAWLESESLQTSFGGMRQVAAQKLSRSERERFQVLRAFNDMCKAGKAGVSLKKHRGLRTMDPKYPINFWCYEPQHEDDRAPIKETRKS